SQHAWGAGACRRQANSGDWGERLVCVSAQLETLVAVLFGGDSPSKHSHRVDAGFRPQPLPRHLRTSRHYPGTWVPPRARWVRRIAMLWVHSSATGAGSVNYIVAQHNAHPFLQLKYCIFTLPTLFAILMSTWIVAK